jgi:site-specific recombinase XerD
MDIFGGGAPAKSRHLNGLLMPQNVRGSMQPFRHAHASHALDRGEPIHLVQATLGQASVSTTGKYLHARPGDSSAKYLGV